jgi:hypothetical protein
MGIESEEGLRKSGGVVPKRSSGSVSGTQRVKICGVQSGKSKESGREERVKTPVRGLVVGKSEEEEVESASVLMKCPLTLGCTGRG